MPNPQNILISSSLPSGEAVSNPAITARAHFLFLIVTLLAGTLVRLTQFSFPLGGSNSFRKTQTAFVAREFFTEGIDLFSYPLKIFGTALGVPFEMPIFQAGAALLQHLGFQSDASGQVLSFFMFQISAVLTWILATRWFSREIALVSTVLFQFVPYSLEWASAYLIESTALAFSMAMVLCLDNWRRSRSYWQIAWAILFSVVSFLMKITTPPGWIVASAVYFYLHRGQGREWYKGIFSLWPVVVTALLGLIAGVLWTRHADSIKMQHPATEVYASSRLNEWNFGSLDQRLDLLVYIGFAERIGLEVMGFTLILLPVALIIGRKLSSLPASISLICLAAFGPLVFLNLYRHDYYFLANLPAFVILSGWVISTVIIRLTGNFSRRVSSIALVVLLFTLYTSTLGLSSVRSAFSPPELDPLARSISLMTSSDSKLVLVGCEWDPSLLYNANRRGMMVVEQSQESLVRLWSVENINNYDYVVFCGERHDWFPTSVMIEPVYSNKIYRIAH